MREVGLLRVWHEQKVGTAIYVAAVTVCGVLGWSIVANLLTNSRYAPIYAAIFICIVVDAAIMGIGWAVYRASVVPPPAAGTTGQTSAGPETQPALEAPRFAEKLDKIYIQLGSITNVYRPEHSPFTPLQIGDVVPVTVRLEGGRLYADAVLSGERDAVLLQRNRIVQRPPEWDVNSNERALEVVDERGRPVFQMILVSEQQLKIRGVFRGKAGSAVFTDTSTFNTSPTADRALNLKPLFKYPAWKFAGQLAEEQ
jgi:hypothetical protein